MKIGSHFICVVIAVAMALASATSVHAIPAFSRQNKTECSTCHTIYPELNEYGEAFLKNSYVYMGKPGAVKESASAAVGGEGGPDQAKKQKEQAPTGGESEQSKSGAKEMKNEWVWLSGIPELIPVSFSASLNFAYNDDAVDNDKFDIAARAVVLQAGGAFRDMAGFYFTYNLYTQGRFDPLSGNVPGNNSPDIDELFLTWRHALSTPVNLKIGRLKPKLSLWKGTNKATITPFATQVYKVGRSPFFIDSSEDAIEANAILAHRLFLAGGIVDRNGQNYKDGYGHVSYKFGGADFLGEEPEIDFESDSIWDYLMVTIGAYGYYGTDASLVDSVADKFNHFYRAGVDLDLLYKRFRLRFSGVEGKDTNPSFLAVAEEVRSTVIASELEALIGSSVIAVFRYEYQDNGSGIINRYIPAVAYAPLQNIRLVLEYNHEAAPHVTNNIAQLGVTFSF